MSNQTNHSDQNNRGRDSYEAGRAQMDARNYVEAIQLFERSIAIFPHFKTLELLGECKLKMKEPIQAIIVLAAAVGLGTNAFRAMYLLAEGFVLLNNRKEAIKHLDRALELNPDFRAADELRVRLISELPSV